MRYKVVMLDLDGTIIDPYIGITESVHYALTKMGQKNVVQSELTKFIGPPLIDSFQAFYGMSEAHALQSIDYYRETFNVKGKYDFIVYEGMIDLINTLKEKGFEIVIATSKPTPFAIDIINHIGIANYFTHIVGSYLDGRRNYKKDIIAHIMSLYPNYSNKDFIMVGDREHDVLGAKYHNIDTIAVSYGYGSTEELQHASPTHIVADVDSLRNVLLKN